MTQGPLSPAAMEAQRRMVVQGTKKKRGGKSPLMRANAGGERPADAQTLLGSG